MNAKAIEPIALTDAGRETIETLVPKKAFEPMDWMPLPKSTEIRDDAPQKAEPPRVFSEFGSDTEFNAAAPTNAELPIVSTPLPRSSVVS